ncbi:DUF1816 domain-containing protein [Aetokthonos hydrillicola Thurmond2011]|jgi:hypothetical protein|uniref:DUF1816 domain-containing protein n=1 Tax=Aetokthonos hydrillicola Thurmond2011 TaxID=2712845 RepID=A0AAP5I5K6_9CYAN|nr:DUF1816 domain-containing protein [Aetokthonos hydrillicola]MBO3459391.1 DUF1816 domain-containing protein [Aetokthonos hydrillicola CCALA 1050]MBW4586537.1 DUF1816 domain-containing protein [Aetokthonos hydrillicola CCALA 1050]MDR9893518.1 DUF1816 domain-containing protein [Aetokthonos hydrillicola Thurmond2011]
MTLIYKIKKEFLDFFLLKSDNHWWIEISTAKPHCIYYFGPFQHLQEAKTAQYGYVEDLESEAAEEIVVNIKYCNPDVLTVFNEEEQLNLLVTNNQKI